MTDIYLSNSNLITDEDLFQQSISIAMDFSVKKNRLYRADFQTFMTGLKLVMTKLKLIICTHSKICRRAVVTHVIQ